MRLGQKIVFYIVLCCVVPLILLAVGTGRVAREGVEAAVTEGQADTARLLALAVARQLAEAERLLQVQMRSYRLETAPDEARAAFLVATARLVPEVRIAALVDRGGALLVPAQTVGEVPIREVERFLGGLVLAEAGGVGRGAAAGLRLPITVASPYDEGYLLAAQISLEPAAAQIDALSGDGREILLLDAAGAVLHRAGPDLVDPARLRALLESGTVSIRYTAQDGGAGESLAAMAPAGEGLRVVVAEPAAGVLEAAGRLESQSWFLLALSMLAAVVMGGFLTRSLTEPVQRLSEGVRRIGRGDFGAAVDASGSDELAELGRAFNEMARSLARSSEEIAAKNRQIEAFNEELQARVEQRTAELRAAQARLVQTEQLSAVSGLAAGMAHELNNPLAGVLGVVQLLRAQAEAGGADRAPEAGLLAAAEEQALRCREILSTLSRFEAPPGDASGDAPEPPGVIDLGGLVRDVCMLTEASLRERGIRVEVSGMDAPDAGGLRLRGAPLQTRRALAQTIAALRGLAALGATLRMEGRAGEGGAELWLSLSASAGRQDDWQAAGLGFWAARQVLAAQGATLEQRGEAAWRLCWGAA